MAKRHRDEVVLARWTVDATHLREFALTLRPRYGDSPFRPYGLLEECEKRSASCLEVVCRDDAIFVGAWGLDFQYNVVSGIRLDENWILLEMDWGAYDIPVPVPRDAKAEAARMVGYYRSQWEEELRQYLEKRHAPTWQNRLLNVAEAHFAWVTLGFFFIAIPIVVLLIGLFRH